MKTVPVLINFDENKLIGHLIIDETKILQHPDWVLSLGYIIKDYEVRGGITTVTDCEIFSVSLQTDKQYGEFLKATGRI
jgi:hypothetical protein